MKTFWMNYIFVETTYDHTFSTYASISINIIFLNPLPYSRTCAYQGVRNVTFSDNSADVRNE